MQVREAQDDRRRLPERRRQGRRDRRTQIAARKNFLRLLQLSRLRLRPVEPADRREMSEVRRAVPRREDDEEARTPVDLQQERLRLRAVRGTGRNPRLIRYTEQTVLAKIAASDQASGDRRWGWGPSAN